MSTPTTGYTAVSVEFTVARENEPPFLSFAFSVPLDSEPDRDEFHDIANTAAVAAYNASVATYPGNTFRLLRSYRGARPAEDITPA